MVEPSAAKSGQPAAEQSDPQVTRLGVDIECRDGLPRQSVLLLPALYLARLFVEPGQPVLGTNPHIVPVGLDRKDVIVRQPGVGGKVFPLGIDVGEFLGRNCRVGICHE